MDLVQQNHSNLTIQENMIRYDQTKQQNILDASWNEIVNY